SGYFGNDGNGSHSPPSSCNLSRREGCGKRAVRRIYPLKSAWCLGEVVDRARGGVYTERLRDWWSLNLCVFRAAAVSLSMLTARIIPARDVDWGGVVRGVNFATLRAAGAPVEVARRYEEQGADELVFLDISASHEGRAIMLDVVRRVSEEIFMPFTVGGGIRTLEDATRLIQAGGAKGSINIAACR